MTEKDTILDLLQETMQEKTALAHHPARDFSMEDKTLYLRILASATGREEDSRKMNYVDTLLSTFGFPPEEMAELESFAQSPNKESIREFVDSFKDTSKAIPFLLDVLEMSRRDEISEEVADSFFVSIANTLGISKGMQEKIRKMHSLCFEEEPVEDVALLPLPPEYALHILGSQALEGNGTAKLYLGIAYKESDPPLRDDAKALEILQHAAEKGNPQAQYYLGEMYEIGQGVGQDIPQAAKWYTKAAEQGFGKAQRNLGTLYLEGRGVSQNDTKAAKWYAKAAEQGIPTAQNNLGSMYEEGRGISRDDTRAARWYAKAAQ